MPEENVVLTTRDEEIFQWIHEQKYMTVEQIARFFWPECKPTAGSGRQRLKKLLDAEYLKTRALRIKGLNYRPYLLAEKGLNELRQRNNDYGLSEIHNIHEDFVSHTLKLTEIRGLFRELGQKKWTSERVMRKQESQRFWFPDGALDVNGLKIAIELENSYRTKERYQNRLNLYEKDKDFTLVLYVVTWNDLKSWLLELDYPTNKIAFVLYKHLMEKKGEVMIGNKASAIKLGSLLQ